MPRVNSGGDCFIVGGHFVLSGPHLGILLTGLPPVVYLHSARDKAELRWALEGMRIELSEDAC